MGPGPTTSKSADLRIQLHQAIAANKREPSEERAAECRRLAAYYRKALEDEKAALAFESEVREEVKRLTDEALGDDFRMRNGVVIAAPATPTDPLPRYPLSSLHPDASPPKAWQVYTFGAAVLVVIGALLAGLLR